jgi:hypothetical protein
MNNIECEECGELANLVVHYGGVDNTEHFCRNCYNNILRDIITRYDNRHIEDLIWALKCVMDNVTFF